MLQILEPAPVPAVPSRPVFATWFEHFDDWNSVPTHIRVRALTAMVEQYRWVADGPRVWREMTAEDWDGVPQPIRAMAFIRLAQYWGRRYQGGREYGLSRALVGNTVAAILMVESWFEHRGEHTNADGTQDVGLGGASDYCRRVMRELHAAGQVDFAVSDQDYFNPWRTPSASWLSGWI